jgi:hypothetical protein
MERKHGWPRDSIRHNSEVGIIRWTRSSDREAVLGLMGKEVNAPVSRALLRSDLEVPQKKQKTILAALQAER